MERTAHFLLFVFILATVKGKIGRHVFVPQKMDWREAQAHCQRHYTDLSSVNSQEDNDELLKALHPKFQNAWIGLHKDSDPRSCWKWSGGGCVTYVNWGVNEPNNWYYIENKAAINSAGYWFDLNERHALPFYCINVTVTEEEKTWEEALEHCREQKSDLISLDSETDQLHVLSEIRKRELSHSVWTGLRFLGDRWLWVNGKPLAYEDWTPGDDSSQQCPTLKRCGVVAQNQRWKNKDCIDKRPFICH